MAWRRLAETLSDFDRSLGVDLWVESVISYLSLQKECDLLTWSRRLPCLTGPDLSDGDGAGLYFSHPLL